MVGVNRFSKPVYGTVSRRLAPVKSLPGATRDNGRVNQLRGMPWGVALFLVYGLLILAGVGLALGPVVEQAVLIPITLLGAVLMALLAYTIFTVTLVIQRKEAARNLALGLVSLTVPAIPLALLYGQLIGAIFITSLALLLFRGLRTPAALAWLDQP
jgi:hypothetical protein